MTALAQKSDGDLYLSNGRLLLITGVSEHAQKIQNKLRLFKGEWFLDTRLGVPYYDVVLIKNPDLEVIKRLFREVILSVEGVVEITSLVLEWDRENRSLSYTFTALDDEGNTIDGASPFVPDDEEEVEVLPPSPVNSTPGSGPETGGTEVVIVGSHFTGATAVTICGADAASFTVDSDNQITAVTDVGTPGIGDIVVINTVGSGTLTDAFEYIEVVDAPIIDSINVDIGDTDGQDTVIITGSNFTGTTDVSFGGNAAFSFNVDSDTQITAVTGATTAGTVAVHVTNPGGTDSLLAAYEFWSPAELTPQVFYEGNYVAATGTWTPRYTVFSTGQAGKAIQTTPANRPAASGGYPDFNSASTNHLRMNETVAQVFGTGDFSILAVVEVDSIQSNSGTLYNGDGIVTDPGQFVGLHLGSATKDKASLFVWPGSAKYAQTDLGTDPVSGRFVLAAKKVSGAMKITQDGSSWTTGDTGVGAPSTTTTSPYIGGGSTTGAYLNGRIKALIMTNTAWSDANVAKFYRWAAARHP